MHDGISGGIAYCNLLFFFPAFFPLIQSNKFFIVIIFGFFGIFFQSKEIIL